MLEIVTKAGCNPCESLKERLTADNIPFKTFDVYGLDSITLALREEMQVRGIRTVPAIFLNGEYIGNGDTPMGEIHDLCAKA